MSDDAARSCPAPDPSDGMAARIGVHDWSATPLGPRVLWSEGLRTVVDLMLASGHAMCLAWGPARTLLYNDAYAPMLGDRHPDALGLPLRKAWPDVWKDIAPLVDRVFAGETVRFGDMPLLTTRHGYPEESWRTFSCSPVRDSSGDVAGLLNVTVDTSLKIRAEAALRASVFRLSDVLDSMTEGFALLGSDFTILDVNGETLRLDGRSRAELVGRSHWEAFPGSEDAPVGEAFRRVARERTPASLEHEYRWPDGRTLWVDMRAYPTRDGGVAVFWRDVTDRRRADERLREREADLSRVQRIGGVGGLDIDVPDGLVGSRSPEYPRLHGLSPDGLDETHSDWRARLHPDDADSAERTLFEALEGDACSYENFRGWLDLILPEDRAYATAMIRRVRASQHVTFEYRIRRPRDGAIRWLRDTDFPIGDETGKVLLVGGIGHDITSTREAEERQNVLLAELQHRVRSILAVVRSIVSRSDDGERETEDYVRHLQGRISALARTQILLTRSPGADVDLEDMIRDELLAQAARPDQFWLDGPDVPQSPKAAEVLSLAIHELATNATKYGAFSTADGRLRIDWRVEARDGEDWLVLDWWERGVSVAHVAPRRRGFGTELISKRIPYELKGVGGFELKPGGLESRIEFPLRRGDSILETSGVSP